MLGYYLKTIYLCEEFIFMFIDFSIFIATFIIILVIIFKYWDYKNPYVDELISEKEKVGNQNDWDEYTYTERLFKRTYKNGKVKYVTKTY